MLKYSVYGQRTVTLSNIELELEYLYHLLAAAVSYHKTTTVQLV